MIGTSSLPPSKHALHRPAAGRPLCVVCCVCWPARHVCSSRPAAVSRRPFTHPSLYDSPLLAWEEEGQSGCVRPRECRLCAVDAGPHASNPPQPTQEGQLYYERDTQQPPHLPSAATAPFGLRAAASVQTDRAPPSPHPTPCHDKAADSVGHDVREAVSDKPVLRCVCFDWDGTVVDSVTSIIRCWVRAVKEGKKTARDNKRRRQAADGSGDCDDDMTLIRRWTRGVWRERFAKRLACRSMTCPWCSVRTMTKRRTKRSRPHTYRTHWREIETHTGQALRRVSQLP
ncbi:unnamed protein product [Vitrella brassicaformis CCMP3155]|uniref:Uncharacterized protein n=1 Tax=Vitrella brassicaformis (strain CCMP3155) TaxID=1169540 RepID=A0A0G4GYW3_VITBC|nr:unnamed protein product [Vitrella brassicaformis CCMP3155]|eukprot:CEM36228.1 unnamed protein product [Vitrella brassicaformis CCMP3155]